LKCHYQLDWGSRKIKIKINHSRVALRQPAEVEQLED